MPDVPRTIFIEKVEDVALILLLPLFFVFGFKTEIGLINDPYLWKVTGFIILVAVVGNFRKCSGSTICGSKLAR
jgi:Kef-type K+ transport system membrane component KefB